MMRTATLATLTFSMACGLAAPASGFGQAPRGTDSMAPGFVPQLADRQSASEEYERERREAADEEEEAREAEKAAREAERAARAARKRADEARRAAEEAAERAAR